MNYENILAVGLAGLLVSCSASAPTSSAASVTSEEPAPAPAGNNSLAALRKNDMTALQRLLTLFASANGNDWEAYDGALGVDWRDPEPAKNPDANAPDAGYYRSGNLLLAGYEKLEVPSGEVGADAEVEEANEGDSGITLNGDVNNVQSIVLMKFYPEQDYQKILGAQLGDAATLKPIANKCELDYGTTAENTEGNAFYSLRFDSGDVIYAEGSTQDGGNSGPGYTVLSFYKSRPNDRVTTMRCHEV